MSRINRWLHLTICSPWPVILALLLLLLWDAGAPATSVAQAPDLCAAGFQTRRGAGARLMISKRWSPVPKGSGLPTQMY